MSTCLMSMYIDGLSTSPKDGSQTISNDSFYDEILVPTQGSPSNQQENYYTDEIIVVIEKPNLLNKLKKEFIKVCKSTTTKKSLVIIAITGGLILYPGLPVRAFEEASKAIDPSNIEKTPFLKSAGHKAKMGILVVTGLKVCTDPSAPPPIKKVIAGAKLICCGGYAGANIISNIAAVRPQTKIITSGCCALSWAALSGLEYLDAQRN